MKKFLTYIITLAVFCTIPTNVFAMEFSEIPIEKGITENDSEVIENAKKFLNDILSGDKDLFVKNSISEENNLIIESVDFKNLKKVYPIDDKVLEKFDYNTDIDSLIGSLDEYYLDIPCTTEKEENVTLSLNADGKTAEAVSPSINALTNEDIINIATPMLNNKERITDIKYMYNTTICPLYIAVIKTSKNNMIIVPYTDTGNYYGLIKSALYTKIEFADIIKTYNSKYKEEKLKNYIMDTTKKLVPVVSFTQPKTADMLTLTKSVFQALDEKNLFGYGKVNFTVMHNGYANSMLVTLLGVAEDDIKYIVNDRVTHKDGSKNYYEITKYIKNNINPNFDIKDYDINEYYFDLGEGKLTTVFFTYMFKGIRSDFSYMVDINDKGNVLLISQIGEDLSTYEPTGEEKINEDTDEILKMARERIEHKDSIKRQKISKYFASRTKEVVYEVETIVNTDNITFEYIP